MLGKDSTRFLGELNPSLKNTQSLIWDQFKNSEVSFHVLKFSLGSPSPPPSPLQAALHPPAQRTPAYFLQLGTLGYLLSPISLVSSIRLSPFYDLKKSSDLLYSKNKIKGKQNWATKKTSSASSPLKCIQFLNSYHLPVVHK